MLVLGVPAFAGCGGSSGGNGEPNTVITVGNITDLTGPGAVAYANINAALDDFVEYTNEEDPIPGVRLEVLKYDGQLDPARDIPGYEWLRQKGADLIFAGIPATPASLQARVNRDRFVVFTVSGDPSTLEPPGYVFNLGTLPQQEALTLLEWVAENHWDYRTKGPALIGGAGWDDAYTGWFLDSIEDYAKVHPDRFEWVGGHLTNIGTYTWGPEVEALRNADYVLVPSIMTTFVKQYRDAGGTGTFMGGDPQAAFFSLISDANLWDEIDGMLFIRSTAWWNEDADLVSLSKRLLFEKHPEDAEDIMRSGVGYLSQVNINVMIDIVRQAVMEVGAEALDSEALYETAQSYSRMIDGIERFSFGESKRWANNYFAPYVARADERDIFRLTDEWLPAVTEP